MARLVPRAALLRMHRPLQLCLAIYIFIAVVYTTKTLIAFPLNNVVRWILDRTAKEANILGFAWSSHREQGLSNDAGPPGTVGTHSIQTAMSWPNNGSHASRTTMDTSLFLSKAFSQSMKPSEVIPFYYRAEGIFDPEDVTITTLITSNRFKVFAGLVQSYLGPISVTLHVTNKTEHKRDLLAALHDLYNSTPLMRQYVDVHLVVDPFDRQFNTWRNTARLFARTEFVMMLDVDFAICTDLRSSIRNNAALKERMREENVALVVPAFEFVKQGVTRDRFPTDKKLTSLAKSNRIAMFHAFWPVGHNSSEYERFFAAEPGEVYKVTKYQSAYEPYVIFRKDGPPWCDERFIGYGGNKAACLFEMYISGVSFRVLADHFLIHQEHPYEEKARRAERRYNKKMYADFREETCLRYLKSYHDADFLGTSRATNMEEECMRIKSVARVVARLRAGHGGPNIIDT